MINIYNFITKTDYPEFKKIMIEEFKTKPLDIKGTSAEEIALEVKASQLAIIKLETAFQLFEAQAKVPNKEKQPWR